MKIKRIILFCVVLSILSGCSNRPASFKEDDIISEYDLVEDVGFEGIDGHFTIREKKYSFGEGDLIVMRVENVTGKNCSIEINGSFKKNDGNVVKEERKQFYNFSADDSNYFFFDPGIKFDIFTYEVRLIDVNAKSYSVCWEFSTEVHAEMFTEPCPQDYLDDVIFKSAMKCVSPPESLNIDVSVLVFDNAGNPAFICSANRSTITSDLHTIAEDICEKNGEKYALPSQLQGKLRCIVSMIKIYSEVEWAERFQGMR